ncbi:MAG: hypothetical protein A3K19_19980 [Lentisphaerae bacterium RIFOXYB12_FULL_65_16]|nr:MAG: hypothetical protein A3K18_07260 [Lentisphaerae bacterium RIFOXYA12_64_32]OGV85089.1 MAG: hypothetical protein A3K19_19980 [Lentisphaerae bacterium RIFOXYB12_FULL_65_16]
MPLGGTLPDGPAGRALGLERVQAFCGRSKPPASESRFRRDDWVIGGTLGGTVLVVSGRRQYRVDAGMGYVIPPSTPFIERKPARTEWGWSRLLLKTTTDSPMTAGLPLQPMPVTLPLGFFEQVTAAATELYTRDRDFECLALGLILQAVAQVVRYLPGRPSTEVGFVRHACNTMRRRVTSGIRLHELAEECSMSLSSFCHRFQAETGTSPMRWFMQERVRAAKRLLLEGRNVAEVSNLLGFPNPFHFSRAFKSVEGVPPSRFGRRTRCTRSTPRDAVANHAGSSHPDR